MDPVGGGTGRAGTGSPTGGPFTTTPMHARKPAWLAKAGWMGRFMDSVSMGAP